MHRCQRIWFQFEHCPNLSKLKYDLARFLLTIRITDCISHNWIQMGGRMDLDSRLRTSSIFVEPNQRVYNTLSLGLIMSHLTLPTHRKREISEILVYLAGQGAQVPHPQSLHEIAMEQVAIASKLKAYVGLRSFPILNPVENPLQTSESCSHGMS